MHTKTVLYVFLAAIISTVIIAADAVSDTGAWNPSQKSPFAGLPLNSNNVDDFNRRVLFGEFATSHGNHPSSMRYDEGKSSLRSVQSQLVGVWKGATTISDLLINGKMECSSCHEPVGLEPTKENMRNSNTTSELCLSCHDI